MSPAWPASTLGCSAPSKPPSCYLRTRLTAPGLTPNLQGLARKWLPFPPTRLPRAQPELVPATHLFQGHGPKPVLWHHSTRIPSDRLLYSPCPRPPLNACAPGTSAGRASNTADSQVSDSLPLSPVTRQVPSRMATGLLPLNYPVARQDHAHTPRLLALTGRPRRHAHPRPS